MWRERWREGVGGRGLYLLLLTLGIAVEVASYITSFLSLPFSGLLSGMSKAQTWTGLITLESYTEICLSDVCVFTDLASRCMLPKHKQSLLKQTVTFVTLHGRMRNLTLHHWSLGQILSCTVSVLSSCWGQCSVSGSELNKLFWIWEHHYVAQHSWPKRDMNIPAAIFVPSV